MSDAKTEKTIGDELRETAAKLRRVSAGTTEGRWVCGQMEEREDYSTQVAVSAEHTLVAEINLSTRDSAWRYMRDQAVRDGQWIALASPALAEPLASWLEQAAEEFDREVITDTPECPNCGEGCAGHPDALVHDEGCGNWLADADAPGLRCECFDRPLAVARVLNGTTS
ncbi:hypothetical protein FH608_046370 [Nonomuraea phyllanthi]|uniref:Uncharacterized protein n=1 Tax=Nonomuraea phyllanthi TaxID=2219224 RepID=A0A5C4V5Z7_9ACTN|nr:hypothetical protein [Nonomuraea phyllanthi]KAB8186919.1 hypothetical protein FH608_046370 [Nonomuraea phyllanthi]